MLTAPAALAALTLLAAPPAPPPKPGNAQDTRTPAAPPPTRPATGAAPAKDQSPGFYHFDAAALDPKVDPCDDFFAYACNVWISKNPIPADRGRWGVAGQLSLANQYELRGILEQAAQPRKDRKQAERQIGDDYAACMDEPAIDKLGAQALAPELQRIDAMKDLKDLPAVLARLHLETYNLVPITDSGGFTPLFLFNSSQDYDNAKLEVANVDQGGLGLPDREYYLKQDPKSVETRKAYVAHVQKMLELAGEPAAQAGADAQSVLDVETALAQGAMDLVKRRDPANLNHKLSLAQLQALTPHFDWKVYTHDVGMPKTAHFLVETPDFFKDLDGQLASRPLPVWKAYLRWHLVHAAAGLLSKPFVDEHFAFYEQRLRGVKELPPRWKRCAEVVDRDLGEALGAVYAQKAFPPSSKKRMEGMVRDIEAAMMDDIQHLDWMGAATKKQALVKLRGILDKIGYPDHPRDYAAVHVARDTALANAFSASEFELHRQLHKIGKAPDRKEWLMTAPTVNAYYDPQMNSINFPAGILQPPFFDAKMNDAVNYGSIGAVIGHELTHGFDDQGSKFDATGNLRDWWTKQDAQGFSERESCIADEYSGFTVLDGLHVNGKLTLGENTADNGGLRLAHAAWLADMKRKREKVSPAMEKDFFLAYAQSWCGSWSDASLRLLVQTNPHAPNATRVNGVVRNMEPFREVFGCKAGAPLAPAKPCRVW